MVEGLLILVILTLGSSLSPRGDDKGDQTLVRFKAAPEQSTRENAPQDDTTPETRPSKQSPPRKPEPTPPRFAEPPRDLPSPSPIRLSPKSLAAVDVAMKPRPTPPAASRGPMGPPDTGPRPSDTPRVSGSGPNGEPLYAASWYREPYDSELSGYLSTATGPGWGLIACRTAPDFRVEDCVAIDEYPSGSRIARSVLAAAWQFQVRPPRIGGQLKIGEWVRIRIDYDLRRP